MHTTSAARPLSQLVLQLGLSIMRRPSLLVLLQQWKFHNGTGLAIISPQQFPTLVHELLRQELIFAVFC